MALLLIEIAAGAMVLRHPSPSRAAEQTYEPMTVQVPPEIKAAVLREVGDGKLVGLSTDQDDDKNLIWVAHALINDEAYTVRFETDGALIDKENDEPDPPFVPVAAASVPAAVKQTLTREIGNIPTEPPERQDWQQIFEYHLKLDGQPMTVRIDQTGRLLSKERDTDDEGSGKKSA